MEDRKIHIPAYLVCEWLRHFRRLAIYGRYNEDDTRTANAFRMAKKDVRRMERYINQYKHPNAKK